MTAHDAIRPDSNRLRGELRAATSAWYALADAVHHETDPFKREDLRAEIDTVKARREAALCELQALTARCNGSRSAKYS